MELSRIAVLNKLVSASFCRSIILRNLIGLPATGSCHSKNPSNEYYSDSDDDFGGRKPNAGNFRRNRSNFDNESFDNEQSFGNQRSFDNRRNSNFGQRFDNRGGPERDRFSNAGENLRKIQWDSEALNTANKNTYIPSDTVDERSEEEVLAFRATNEMTVTGKDIPKPILEFSDYEFTNEVKTMLNKKGFERPTPIQAQSWPAAYRGRDMVGIGQTGSGKTLGYILPAMSHIKAQESTGSGEWGSSGSAQPIALVMAPTRELAQQIDSVARECRESRYFTSACLYGGAPKSRQQGLLSRNPSICIATPGRLLDFLEMGSLNLKKCSYLVLDEADRMLDMGFEPQIRKVVSQVRPDRQTLMWSATWPKEIRSMAHEFLNDFVQIKLGSSDLTANADIVQKVEICGRHEKQQKLKDIVLEEIKNENPRILIFSSTKRMADELTYILRGMQIRAASIHGDKSQSARDMSLEGFRRGRFEALIATDVAARGIDVNDISLVLNYDIPNNIEDYIHRIGRTGRAGKAGKSISIMTEEDAGIAKDLIKILRESNQEVSEELVNLQPIGGGRAGNSRSFNRPGRQNQGFQRRDSWGGGHGDSWGGGNRRRENSWDDGNSRRGNSWDGGRSNDGW